MTQYLSDKLRLISFVCIVLVLYIHSGFHYTDAEVGGMALNYNLQESISGMLGRMAVPMFFAISGYLFFKGTENNKKVVCQKLRRRFRTLVIPFLLAALFQPIVFMLLEHTPAAMYMNTSFSQYLSEPWWIILCRVFYYDFPNETPFAFQLWFLRDLIIVICFTPLLWKLKCIRLGMEAFMLLMLVLILLNVNHIPTKAFFWFCFGAQYLPKFRLTTLAPAGMLFYIFVSILQLVFQDEGWTYLEVPIIIVGLFSLWAIYDQLVPQSFILSSHKSLWMLSQCTFFVYLYHMPLLHVIRKTIVILLHPSSMTYAISYLLSPWILIVCLVVISVLLNKIVPRFYAVLVGGRV